MPDDISIPRPGPMPARTSFTHSYRARRTGLDDGTRRLLIVAGALVLVLLAGMGAWSLTGRRPAGIPVIEAESGPVRVKPENPGGMQVFGANEQIMGNGPATGTDKMGPTAEAPDPQALRAQAMPPPAPAQPVSPLTSPPPAASAQPAPAQPAPAQPAPAQSVPGPASAAVSPLPDTPAPARSAAARAAPTTPPAAGGTMVQIAALDSEAGAKAEWQRLSKRMPDVLGGRDPLVQRAERDGKAFWRIRLGGFADSAEANAFCGRVRANGGACSLASF